MTILGWAVATSCGSRSQLLAGDRGGRDGSGHGGEGLGGGSPSSSSGSRACTVDAECDDGVDCTDDSCEPNGCSHAPDDALCNDGVTCTLDTCVPASGCSNVLGDAACDDAIACTNDTCDIVADACDNEPCDILCSDETFCNGVERCDSTLGCTAGPDACELDLACANSACDEPSDSCDHDFPMGCSGPDVHLLVTDSSGDIYDVAPFEDPTQALLVASAGVTHLDIAVLAGRWFVIDSGVIRELQPGTNTAIATVASISGNSLGAGPDDQLYAASTSVSRVDPDSGAIAFVANLPPGHSSSGDIAFLGERMFVSTQSPCGGALVEIDVAGGTGQVLGGDGLGCVYGLASVDDELYLVNCDGSIASFDPDTGEVRVLASTQVDTYGADRL